jgi:hypothetical protein
LKTLLTIITLLVVCGSLAIAQQTDPPQNFAAAGVSYNNGATPKVAGTGLYARLVASSTGTYAFTAVDALPNTTQPFTVTTQVSMGVAQRIVTIGPVPIYIPTSAGISYSGTNTGWAWTTGGLAVIPLRGSWKIVPNIRAIKGSVSQGTGYQVIVGVLFGWGW